MATDVQSAGDLSNIFRVIRYVRPYWRFAVASTVVTILAVGAGLLIPWPLKLLFDNVLGDKAFPPVLAPLLGPLSDDRVTLLVVVMSASVIITLLSNALDVLGSYINTRLAQHMILDFRSDMFQHAQRLSLAFHDRGRSGMMIYSINYQADAAANLALALQPLAQSALTLVGMFWVLLHIDTTLALLSLTVVPLLTLAIRYYVTHIQARLLEVKGMEGETLSIIHEAISMLRVIVAFGRETHEHQRFRTYGERAVDARVKLTVRQTVFTLSVNMTTAVGTAMVLGYGAYLALQGRLTGGDLLIALTYMSAVYRPLESISYTVGALQDQLVSLRMAFGLMDTVPEVRDAPDAVEIAQTSGHVVYDNISFSYQGRKDTLRDISFEARPGQVIGIVGPTGAGKSTLVSLLPRFYDPQHGRILLDGTDIRSVSVRSLRAQISIVLQEPLLFSGTIAENIRYGRLDAGMDEIVEAARSANAHDFITLLPAGYDTLLGERGAQLSGGERQRISVARAFLKDAPILILDEPTSSIDSRTEAIILDALERLMHGRTTFMIAHRLSTIHNADRILVMDHGEIVDQGSHEELMERGGLYRQLHDAQGPRSRRAPLATAQAGISRPGNGT